MPALTNHFPLLEILGNLAEAFTSAYSTKHTSTKHTSTKSIEWYEAHAIRRGVNIRCKQTVEEEETECG